MNDIDCAMFEQWLDAGADPALDTAMHAHAAGCPSCAAALAAMTEIDAWLAAPVAAPREFTDAIMARIAHALPVSAMPPADDMPWWLAVLQHPAVVLATVVAALLLWKADALVAGVAIGTSWLAETIVTAESHLAAWMAISAPAALSAPGSTSLAATGVALALAPLLAYGSLALAGWVAGRIARPAL